MIWVISAIAIIEAIIIITIWIGASVITQANQLLTNKLQHYEDRDHKRGEAKTAEADGAGGADDDPLSESTNRTAQGGA